MAQFDVMEIHDPVSVRFVVVLQADFYADLPTVLVIPMEPVSKSTPYAAINPIIAINGVDYVVKVQETGSMPTERLGRVIESLGEQRYEITNALDRLISGF